jgi:membrane-associated protease RseP (regulator of RpoE activity)
VIVALAGFLYLRSPAPDQPPSVIQTKPLRPVLAVEPDAVPDWAPPEINEDAAEETVPKRAGAPVREPPPAAVRPDAADDVVRGDWIYERYEAAQEERKAIKAAANCEHRKLNVKERIAYWEVEARLIDEIGADAYDELLYENGRHNRTRVNWVAPRSNAGHAGIENGDILVSYGGEPVFGPRSAREMNRNFEPGETIVVVVRRGDQLLEFLIDADFRPRGRSGIVNGMTLIPLAVKP